MTDLAKTIAPKSDQLNADDLIAGPITITITRVRGCDEPDQPVAVHFEGDDGKPYKPCKSMRRVMVHCWGPDGNTYAGRRMTLYRDENVQFGGIKVGGIRISHLSHIEREMTMALTATRAKRAPYTVKPLRADVRAAAPRAEATRPPPVDDARFPGDPPLDAHDGGFGASGADPEPGSPEAWAQGVKDDLEAGAFDTVARLDAFCQSPANVARFQQFAAVDATGAARLNAMIQGKRKAMADRERSRG